MEKKKSKKNIIYIMLELVFMVVILFSSYKIIVWHMENSSTSVVLDDIANSVTIDENNEPKVDLNTIKAKYPDVVGWIKVEGTEISFPVVQTTDNDYYLHHSLDKTNNSAGWIFADYKNKLDGTDKNIIIYGHNRKDGSMFSTLKNILNSDWYENENNKYVTFITEEGNTKYEVFSTYQIEDEDYYIKTSFEKNEFSNFINNLKKRSKKDYGTEVTENDSILTLSTCGNNKRYRIVLHAKKTNLQNDNEQIITE